MLNAKIINTLLLYANCFNNILRQSCGNVQQQSRRTESLAFEGAGENIRGLPVTSERAQGPDQQIC